ncbi:MAG: hypothetical protein WC817_02510 [Patescibacteria group bacterium]|jgi:hypothetical protein
MSTIEQLFGSPEKIRILRFFLFHPESRFSLAELRQRAGSKAFKKPRNLSDLVRLQAIIAEVSKETSETVYSVNPHWLLYQEFRNLFVKAQLLVERDLIARIERAGKIRLLILAGLFVGEPSSATDMLIVGQINHHAVTRHLKEFEKELDQEVNYTVFTNTEYRYRKNVGDRFLYSILEKPHLVVVDVTDKPAAKTPSQGKTRRKSSAVLYAKSNSKNKAKKNSRG